MWRYTNLILCIYSISFFVILLGKMSAEYQLWMDIQDKTNSAQFLGKSFVSLGESLLVFTE